MSTLRQRLAEELRALRHDLRAAERNAGPFDEEHGGKELEATIDAAATMLHYLELSFADDIRGRSVAKVARSVLNAYCADFDGATR